MTIRDDLLYAPPNLTEDHERRAPVERLQRTTTTEPVDNPATAPVDNPPTGHPETTAHTTTKELSDNERLELHNAWRTTHSWYRQIAIDPRNAGGPIADICYARMADLNRAFRKALAP